MAGSIINHNLSGLSSYRSLDPSQLPRNRNTPAAPPAVKAAASSNPPSQGNNISELGSPMSTKVQSRIAQLESELNDPSRTERMAQMKSELSKMVNMPRSDAANAMMARANQAPQGVLELLDGNRTRSNWSPPTNAERQTMVKNQMRQDYIAAKQAGGEAGVQQWIAQKQGAGQATMAAHGVGTEVDTEG
jgi:hypothetical protein